MEEQQKSINTQLLIDISELNPKIERLLKAYEELKDAASALNIQTWQDCIKVVIKKE